MAILKVFFTKEQIEQNPDLRKICDICVKQSLFSTDYTGYHIDKKGIKLELKNSIVGSIFLSFDAK